MQAYLQGSAYRILLILDKITIDPQKFGALFPGICRTTALIATCNYVLCDKIANWILDLSSNKVEMGALMAVVSKAAKRLTKAAHDSESVCM